MTIKYSDHLTGSEKFVIPRQTVVVLGNGFDLEFKLKSKYSDYLLYIVFSSLINKLYQGEKGDLFWIEQCESKIDDCFNIECWQNWGLGENCQRYISIFKDAKKHLAQNNFNFNSQIIENFFTKSFLILLLDESLYEFIGGVININDGGIFRKVSVSTGLPKEDVFQEVVTNNLKEIFKRFGTANIRGWIDFEKFIEYSVSSVDDLINNFCSEIDKRKRQYFQDYFPLEKSENYANEFYSGVRIFANDFCKYLSYEFAELKENLKDNDELGLILEPYIASLYERSSGLIEDFDLNSVNVVLNYNFTPVAKYLFNKAQLKTNLYYLNGEIYLNGDAYLKNTAIFGCSNTLKNNKNRSLYPLEKINQRIIIDVKTVDFKKLKLIEDTQQIEKTEHATKFDLIIFGHSCTSSDRDVFEKLLSSPLLNVAVVCCFNQESLITAFNNLRFILSDDTFQQLTSGDLTPPKLFFALRNSDSKS